MSSDFQQHIIRIANKLKLLLKQQDQLRKENEKLKQNLAARELELETLKISLGKAEEQISVMKASAGNMDERSKLEFEKKINQYIKDIDKVMVHLNG